MCLRRGLRLARPVAAVVPAAAAAATADVTRRLADRRAERLEERLHAQEVQAQERARLETARQAEEAARAAALAQAERLRAIAEARDVLPQEQVNAEGVAGDRPVLEYIAEQIASAEFFWGLLTNRNLQRMLADARGLPDIVVALPILRGFGYEDLPMPLLRRIALNETAQDVGRVLGRTLGDSLFPPAYVVGYGLTTAPEQVENILTGAQRNEYIADLLVDSGGFVVSEAGGYVGMGFGGLVAGPGGAVGGKLAGDVAAGAGWDLVADRLGWRGELAAAIGNSPEALSAALGDLPQVLAEPIPTPGPLQPSPTQTPGDLPAPTETPQPPSTGTGNTDMGEEITPIVTQTPTPE